MTDHLEATALHSRGEHARGFGLRPWIAANAVGLGTAYALMALLGGGAERWLGVDHDSAVRDVAVFAGLVLGAAVFVVLRQRVLSRSVAGAWWLATAAAAALSVGFVVGFVVAGPPFDFVLGVVTLGTIGGSLQWRSLRHRVARPGALLLASIAGWLTAGVAVLAVAIAAGDAVDTAVGGGLLGFVAVLLLLGLVGGAVGGAIEGVALRRSLHRS